MKLLSRALLLAIVIVAFLTVKEISNSGGVITGPFRTLGEKIGLVSPQVKTEAEIDLRMSALNREYLAAMLFADTKGLVLDDDQLKYLIKIFLARSVVHKIDLEKIFQFQLELLPPGVTARDKRLGFISLPNRRLTVVRDEAGDDTFDRLTRLVYKVETETRHFTLSQWKEYPVAIKRAGRSDFMSLWGWTNQTTKEEKSLGSMQKVTSPFDASGFEYFK
jgi:hypothetical protein